MTKPRTRKKAAPRARKPRNAASGPVAEDQHHFDVKLSGAPTQPVTVGDLLKPPAVDDLRGIVIEYPADWWQAVKARFAPAWARLRWPVQVVTHKVWTLKSEPVLGVKEWWPDFASSHLKRAEPGDPVARLVHLGEVGRLAQVAGALDTSGGTTASSTCGLLDSSFLHTTSQSR